MIYMEISNVGLPPFPALRAFHAAARHGQFRSAAKELGITESAVSHQIRRLEDFLRTRLFDRRGPRVDLTATGRRYFEEIDPAVTRIREATRALVGPQERARVALTLAPSLATLWLIPRLATFEEACPGIDLQLVTTTRLCDLRREQLDLAIRHGGGRWDDVEAEFLLAEWAVPVCKPGYIEAAQRSAVAELLRNRRLIVNEYYPDEWLEWMRAHDVAAAPLSGALRLESQEQILEAAERGLGLAMGRRPLVDERLKSGALIAPFGLPDPTSAGYYLCRPRGGMLTVPARRVARWLLGFADEAPAIEGTVKPLNSSGGGQ